MEEKPVLTEKDLHCIARLLQSAFTDAKHAPFGCCEFCKYKCHTKEELAPNSDELRWKLQKLTGVNLDWNGQILFLDVPPYKKYLINSNEEVKQFFREYFKNVLK